MMTKQLDPIKQLDAHPEIQGDLSHALGKNTNDALSCCRHKIKLLYDSGIHQKINVEQEKLNSEIQTACLLSGNILDNQELVAQAKNVIQAAEGTQMGFYCPQCIEASQWKWWGCRIL